MTINATTKRSGAICISLLMLQLSFCLGYESNSIDSSKVPQTFIGDDDWFLLHPLALCVNYDSNNPVPPMCAMPKAYSLARAEGVEYNESNVFSVTGGDSVVLDSCPGLTEEGWRLAFEDNATLIRTAAVSDDQDDHCLQAGFGEELAAVSRAGTVRIRLAPCDPSSPLQRFVWYEGSTSCADDHSGGSIQLEGDPSMCLGWNNGGFFQPGKHMLRLSKCDDLPCFQGAGWTAW